MKRIATVVGARPQFIKAAALSRMIKDTFSETIIHTGQHFDTNMSDIFFEELEIKRPDYNLEVVETSHAQMTAKMMIGLEQVLDEVEPDAVLVYGDTNSTLAGALTAVKLHYPVIHVEAGGRLGTLSNPEEVNRICTDHLSTIRFACVQSAMDFLSCEGLSRGSYLVGDPMYDAFLHYRESSAQRRSTLVDFDGKEVALPQKYYYLTCHRQENTATRKPLEGILAAMNELDAPTMFPVHPRIVAQALELRESGRYLNVIFFPAVGYLESIRLLCGAKAVVTDSGGVQREAFFAKKPCVTVFTHVSWPETMEGNCNQLARAEKDDILKKLQAKPVWNEENSPFGSGDACERIARVLHEHFL
jgi:UDP-N-acetylglucosamine 2-epimerase (non-hydrolysing)/UDP-GlcNAc3NAcA epimerase